MNSFEDMQFDNEPVPEPASPVQPLGDSLGVVTECARALARHHKFDSGAGLAHCWGCKGTVGVTYPTLHCEACLEAFRARPSATVTIMQAGQPYHYPRYSEASCRFEALKRNLLDPTYDQETCDRILENVRQLPASKGIGAAYPALQAVYEQRFGARQQRRRESVYGEDDE